MLQVSNGLHWLVLTLTGIFQISAIPSAPLLVLKKGSNATLPCSLAAHSHTHCHWLHDGHVINITQQCDQWVWEDPSNEGDCSVRILSARAEIHEGNWECKVDNSTHSLVYVTVREPNTLQVSISRLTGYLARTNNGRMAVTAGTHITANCSASGLRPGDKLEWIKVRPTGNNHSLAKTEKRRPGKMQGTETVEIITTPTITDKDNQAQLVCSVLDQEVNVIFRKVVILEVFSGPQYTAERSSYVAHPNMQVSLRCPLHSNPPATYRWFFLARNGIWIEMQGQRSLELDGVSPNQAGFYNCSASNSFFGQTKNASELVYLNINMEETFRPQKAVCTLRGRVREHVTLLCPAPASPFTRTRWFFQGDDRRWVPISSQSQSLTMFNVNASQAGLYKCVPEESRNKDGCGFIYLTLGQDKMIENLQNILGVALCAVGVIVFIGLLAFVVQISKIKAVLRVQERQSRILEAQGGVWTSDKVGLPYYSLPPAYSALEHPAPPTNNTI